MQPPTESNTAKSTRSILCLCFVMILVCLGFCSSNKSLYLAPITDALSISRSAFSIHDSLRFVTSAVVSLFFGQLVRRFGTKKLILFGIGCLAGSTLISACADRLLWFYAAGILLGAGFSFTTTTMIGCVIGRCCPENKGTIMGAVLASNGIGAAISTQILSPLIHAPGNPFGYRNAYLLTAGLVLAVGLSMLLWYREPKAPAAPDPANKTVDKTAVFRQPGSRGWFWLSLVCIFLSGLVLQGVTGIAAAHMQDQGVDPGILSAFLSVHALALTACKFLTGVLSDRIGVRITALLCNLASIAAMASLAWVSGSALGIGMAGIYAFTAAMALPMETVMLPILAQKLAPAGSYEAVLGWFVSCNTAGYAVGIPLLNGGFDWFGSYTPMLVLLCGVMAVVTLLMQGIFRTVQKKQSLTA